MSDFRYNENAEDLEDKLEEVLDSYQQDREKAAEEAAGKLQMEPPGLENISKGNTASEQVRHIIEEKKQTQKSASDLILELRMREKMRKLASRGRETVNKFLDGIRG